MYVLVQCLISLEKLNLSFNLLKEVPVISTLARNSLTSLDFSNNFLSSLEGIAPHATLMPVSFFCRSYRHCYLLQMKLTVSTFLVTLAFFKLMCFSAVLIYCWLSVRMGIHSIKHWLLCSLKVSLKVLLDISSRQYKRPMLPQLYSAETCIWPS